MKLYFFTKTQIYYFSFQLNQTKHKCYKKMKYLIIQFNLERDHYTI